MTNSIGRSLNSHWLQHVRHVKEKYIYVLCRSSPDGNTSACWQVFLKNINSCSVNVQPITNCLCWPKKLMEKKIHTYVQPVEHCNTAKHIYSPIWFSKDLIRDGTFEAEQKYSAVSKKGRGS